MLTEPSRETEHIKYLTDRRHEVLQKTFPEVFCSVVKACPQRTAVWANGYSVTYYDLYVMARAAAHKLISQGAKKGDIIVLDTGRSVWTVASKIGIWMAGCAYVYMENAYPEARERCIIEECSCHIRISEAWWTECLDELEAEKKAGIEQEDINLSDNGSLALLIYTSGSTSHPKGVMLSQRNVLAAMYNFLVFDVKPGENVGLFAGLGFVAALSDTVSTLAAGASLYIVPGAIRRDIHAMADFYREHSINVTFLPPHMARKLADCDLEGIPMRLLMVGSEPVSNMRELPFRMLNVYGASEMSSMISCCDIGVLPRGVISPVGKLNPWLKGWLVDDDGREVPEGEQGELWLAGPQVSMGYFHLPEKTREHYIPNPFTDEPGYETVFRTCDILRMLPDGNLEYICRKDNMFKVRGFRIENTSVERAMMESAPLREAAAVVFADDGGCNILCGYFTADRKLDPKLMKERMKQIVPYYTVPTCLIQLDELPHNSNGKLDRRALKPPKELNDHKLLEKLY